MVQYHALGVLYHIRKTDRLAVTKLVAKLTKMLLRSPYAVCMLVCTKNLNCAVNKLMCQIQTFTCIKLDKNHLQAS